MINDKVNELKKALDETLSCEKEKIEEACNLLKECLISGGKILVCGNGGSAAEAQHMSAEFISRLKEDRRALASIALTTDSSILTACGNDYGFEKIFSRQVDALACEKDVLVCLTTSGKSPNLIEAAKSARELKCKVLSLTGINESLLEKESDLTIKCQSDKTARIQEVQLFLIHHLVGESEKPFLDNQ
ncbi:MAG: SIS domain-containing protein [Nanoarchaeota archaeon]